MLSRAHARGVVARIASALGHRLSVRASPSGWTVSRAGSAPAVCRTARELAHVLRPDVEVLCARDGADGLLQRMLTEGEHRPVTVARGDVPAGVVGAAPDDRARPVRPEEVIPWVLHACLLEVAGVAAPRLLLSDDEGRWILDPSSHAGG
ncbi:hypothetical protein [Microbacterium sp. JZ37]|uniref:hypothetical protein n=1 Tax=Microbacterium sp. JZ37 TaxID=2654193 RepID=UPI002B47CF30|nr:hypothetical protein [Microbacterium sp. JZ37]WRH16206.1 hypothetical protein GC092_00845 [Microbacterium sp. JZ37]